MEVRLYESLDEAKHKADFSARMNPSVIPSASPFTLAEESSSLSPTSCSSLDPCSSHGISSLQSPSAFPSFDSSQQIEAFQPLSFNSAELLGCHPRHCYGEAALDITQDDSASHGNPDKSSSEGRSPHHAISQKYLCPFHSAAKKTPSQCCEALEQDLGLGCTLEGSSPLNSASAERSISLPPSPSPLWEDTGCSAILPIQYGCKEKELSMFRKADPEFLSSPEPREYSDLLHTRNSNDGSYVLPWQTGKNPQFDSFQTDSQIDDTACIDSHTIHSCCKSSCTMPPEIVSSDLTSLSHSVLGLITTHGDADDKENHIGCINSSRERGGQLLDSLAPLCSVESKHDCKRKGKKETLQEAHKNTKETMCIQGKMEMFLDADAVDEGSKENVSPQVFELVQKRVSRLKADCNGWICPKDAKKKFKPTPRQLMLDKWLTRQR